MATAVLSVKANNRMAILNCISRAGQLSRVEISKQTGIHSATVTALTAEMIDEGLIEEDRDSSDSDNAPFRGRPRVRLTLVESAFMVAGAKIAAEHITVVLLNFRGVMLADFELTGYFYNLDVGQVTELLAEALSGALSCLNGSFGEIAALGLGIPGYVDSANDAVFWSAVLNEPVQGLASHLQQHLGLPVVIDNDVNMVALAEQRLGRAREEDSFLLVTIEQGVGLAIVLNNELFRGVRQVGAEFGHIKVNLQGPLCKCGQRGCLEAYVADYALLREAEVVLDIPSASVKTPEQRLKDLFAAAKAGNEKALNIVVRSGSILGVGLANLINLFDPSLIILSGSRMQHDFLYEEPMWQAIEANIIATQRPLPRIEVHRWSDSMWAKGGAAWATDFVIRQSAKGLLSSQK